MSFDNRNSEFTGRVGESDRGRLRWPRFFGKCVTSAVVGMLVLVGSGFALQPIVAVKHVFPLKNNAGGDQEPHADVVL